MISLKSFRECIKKKPQAKILRILEECSSVSEPLFSSRISPKIGSNFGSGFQKEKFSEKKRKISKILGLKMPTTPKIIKIFACDAKKGRFLV